MIDLYTKIVPRIARGACAGVALLAVASVAPAQQPLELRIGTVTSPVTNHPSATGTLPAPFKLVGGGARANWSTYGSLLTATQPGAPGSNAWTAGSKDHFAAEPVSITAFAIGLADPADDWEVIVREARSAIGPKPTATVTLPAGYVMTGGGCLDDWRATPNAPGNLLTASFPSSTNSWECRGQEHAAASPASIVAYVIGIRPKKPDVPMPELQITNAVSQVGAHVSALAPALPGFIVTGGGAVTRGSSTITGTIGKQPSAGRAIGGRAPATAATEAGQLLTASFPEVPAGATSANGWRAAAKDHVHTSPGVVEAYALNLRFPPPVLVAQHVLIPGILQMPLRGWVDLHTHPMIHLAFGGKLIHGAPDTLSLLPTNSRCQPWLPAGSVQEALGDDRPSHGGWNLINFPCGDELRVQIINQFQSHNQGALVTAGPGQPPRLGYPTFDTWPAWNDITHQKMWWEWIRRARDGGQRVMVALATNNRTLGDGVSGPGDGPTDDLNNGDRQLDQIKLFVSRHADFMQMAYTPAELKSIVESNRIAVVLGVELDNIGNMNQIYSDSYARIQVEIQRLYDKGVRYIFPVHVVDNIFGGTAIYTPMFNIANFRDTGRFWQVECSVKGDDIHGKYAGGFDVATVAAVKIGFDPKNQPPASPTCPQPGHPEQGVGHRNSKGLTVWGEFAIKEMMRRGMIIDIDHMSHKAVEQTLAIAEGINPPVGYPINSGHSGIRIGSSNLENSRSTAQVQRIAKLHGMFGLGTDGVHAYSWSRQYQAAMSYMGYMKNNAYRNGAIAFGTDLNGLVKGPPPGNAATQNRVVYDAAWPMSEFTGTAKKWNYNTDGVAHYGMLPDFLLDVRTSPVNLNLGRDPSGRPYGVTGADLVDNHLQRSADYFWRMWERCETQKSKVW